MEPLVRRILVINGKGGCGKTTIATNLAVAFATRGVNVALLDNDPQASSTYWADLREEGLPPVSIVATHQRPNMYQTSSFHHRLPQGTEMVIVDGHSNARGRDLESLLRQTDLILVPMLPSSIDIRAGGRFITELLTHRIYRAAPRPVGVVANRVQPNTETHDKLMHFLGCLDVPCVAQFRDSPVYTDAVEVGQGVVDMKDIRAARKETAAWKQLMGWIDEQVPPPKRAPLSAGRRDQAGKQPLAAKRRQEIAAKLA
jgi:chromosome partitioning protein